MSAFLASVRSLEEAKIALEYADIIDLKEPSNGALGALPLEIIESIVHFVDGRKLVSATVGDSPMSPQALVQLVEATVAAGVDIVKVGFYVFNKAYVAALEPLIKRNTKLVAVLFADTQVDVEAIPKLALAGFYGVMLDTSQKQGASLSDYMTFDLLESFVGQAHSHHLMAGLAGSLRAEHIEKLAPFAADFLGFRGALCGENQRQGVLELNKILNVKKLLQKHHTVEAHLVV
jgi:uncharacterized protein (UPF0264 family)